MKKNEKILGFNKNKLKQWFLYWTALAAGLFILIFLITITLIGVDVKERCMSAQNKYEGDCVDALVQVVDHEENSLSERNYAVWALGIIGDEKARPVIEKYYTGIIPDREPYDKTLSQYEMKKALKLLGKFNPNHLVGDIDNF
jgi:hypothetical protein